jgi:purine nucleoside phosphorylase
MSQLITCAFSGGTGMGTLFGDLGFDCGEPKCMPTPYGDEVWYIIYERDDLTFLSLDRHNSTGELRLADQLDSRPYVYAMWKLNQMYPDKFRLQFMRGTSAVGGLSNATNIQGGLEVGDIVIPHDVIDFTRSTWSFSIKDRYVHPTAFHRTAKDLLCPHLQGQLRKTNKVKSGGVLACAITGPLYETPAEIVMHARQGICDLFGMQTATQEAYYARQAGLHYSVACVVTDTPDVEHDVDGEEVVRIMNDRKPFLAELFVQAMIESEDMTGFTCSCIKNLPVFHEDLAGDPADMVGPGGLL